MNNQMLTPETIPQKPDVMEVVARFLNDSRTKAVATGLMLTATTGMVLLSQNTPHEIVSQMDKAMGAYNLAALIFVGKDVIPPINLPKIFNKKT